MLFRSLLYQLPRVVDCKRAVIPVPCYIDYSKVMELASISVIPVLLSEKDNFAPDLAEIATMLQPGDLLVLGNPNNPTGALLDAEKCKALAKNNPEVTFLIDEAFLEFVAPKSSLAGSTDNCITLHSLTKFYAIPGLRLGYGIFPVEIAQKLKKILPPWTVNSLAQDVGLKCIQDLEYQKDSRTYFKICRKSFVERLASFSELTVFPSAANYLLIKLKIGRAHV